MFWSRFSKDGNIIEHMHVCSTMSINDKVPLIFHDFNGQNVLHRHWNLQRCQYRYSNCTHNCKTKQQQTTKQKGCSTELNWLATLKISDKASNVFFMTGTMTSVPLHVLPTLMSLPWSCCKVFLSLSVSARLNFSTKYAAVARKDMSGGVQLWRSKREEQTTDSLLLVVHFNVVGTSNSFRFDRLQA